MNSPDSESQSSPEQFLCSKFMPGISILFVKIGSLIVSNQLGSHILTFDDVFYD